MWVASQEHAILYIEQNENYKIILHNNKITKLHLYQKLPFVNIDR